MTTSKTNRPCRLDDELYLKLRVLAEKENRSFNNFVEKILKQVVEDFESKNGTINVDTSSLYD